jgi:hypothetical protein
MGLLALASASWRIMVFAPDSYRDGMAKNAAPRAFSANWRIWAGSDGT